jgi:hypothetical protein
LIVAKTKPFLTVFLLVLSFSLTASYSVVAQKSKSRKPAAPKPTVEVIAPIEPESIAENWKTFNSVEGRFSITFPGGFLRYLKTAQSAEGPVQLYVFSCIALNAEYSVSYADYLSVIEGHDRMKLFLDGVRDSGVKGIRGRLLEDKEIVVDGHPGRAYRIEYGRNKDHLLVGRNVVVGQRLYIIAGTYNKRDKPSTGSYPDWTQRFLDSFTLTKPNSQ